MKELITPTSTTAAASTASTIRTGIKRCETHDIDRDSSSSKCIPIATVN